jgi:hypothetical protein
MENNNSQQTLIQAFRLLKFTFGTKCDEENR